MLTVPTGNGWIAGGGNTVSAQTGEIRDCHYALVQGGTTWRGDWRGYGAAGRGGDTDGDGMLIAVRQSKTNQEADAGDVRYLKNGAAKAIRTLRTDRPDAAPTDRVIGLSPLQVQRRFTAAARAAGIEARLTAHSGRVGLASELTARGASTTEVMLAGNWKTARMVAHYSAGATAERGAVKKYL